MTKTNRDSSYLIQISIEEHIIAVDEDINQLISKLSGNLYYFSQNIKSYFVDHFFFKHKQEEPRTYLRQFREMCQKIHNILSELIEKSNIQVTKLLSTLMYTENIEIIHLESISSPALYTADINSNITKPIPYTDCQKYVRSHEDAFKYFSEYMQLYVPDKKYFNSYYAKGLLNGSKKAFKRIDIVEIDVPNFEEFRLTDCWDQTLQDKVLMSYMPAEGEHKYPNRKFYFNVFNTLYPGKLDYLIHNSFINRNKFKDEQKLEILKNDKQNAQNSAILRNPHLGGNRFINLLRKNNGKYQTRTRKKREMKFSAQLLDKD